MPRLAMRRRLGGALAITVVATLAGLLSPIGVSARAATRKPPQSYVALGDSYTAGPIIPVQQTDPLGCLRSDHNYPHLVAAALGVSNFRDPSCSGAETEDMTMPQGVSPGPNPPQFDSLAADTQLVTSASAATTSGSRRSSRAALLSRRPAIRARTTTW